jgi:hypothetical protein
MSFIYCAQHDPTKSDWRENLKEQDLINLNNQDYGIFKSINIFESSIRKKNKLKKIVALAIDIDDQNKEWQGRRLLDVGVEPSKIIESKRGYHIYWNIKNEMSLVNYEYIVSKMLIPLFNADVGAKDVTRVLRLDGYYHCKDKDNKYLIKKIYESPAVYSEKMLFDLFYMACKRFNIKLQEERKFNKILNTTNTITAMEISMFLNGKKVSNNSYLALCPCHNETKASFRITQKSDKVLLKCFGGCPQDEIIKKMLELNLWR